MTSKEVAVYAKDADAIMTGRGHCPLDAEMLEKTSINAILYCIPHKAGPTIDRRPYVTMCLADNMVKFMNGEEMELEIGGEYASRMTKKR